MSRDLNIDNYNDQEEIAVIVGMNDDRGEIDIEYSMNELRELAYAAGAKVVESVIQNKSTVDVTYYIGKGKAEEIRELCKFHGANLVIFNDELSGSQIRNLEAMIEVKVIDRTCLILDIFARRASSKVSKLQVELAQLRYSLPRLTGLGRSMSRTGGGIGTRGPGEQKLEIDRRRVRERITDIRNELKEAISNRDVQRQQRMKNEIPVVAIVGYTNAGKSTLMNRFLEMTSSDDEKKVFVKDMLFATLDTFSRRITLDDRKSFILVDTVGFVSKLPHSLVEAFKATLEEVIYADMIIHVVDATNSNVHNQISITNNVLSEIGVVEKPTVFAINKCDLAIGHEEVFDAVEGGIRTSALTGEGVDELVKSVISVIFADLTRVSLLIPYDKGSVLSAILDGTSVIGTKYEENGTLIDVELDSADMGRYRDFIVSR